MSFLTLRGSQRNMREEHLTLFFYGEPSPDQLRHEACLESRIRKEARDEPWATVATDATFPAELSATRACRPNLTNCLLEPYARKRVQLAIFGK